MGVITAVQAMHAPHALTRRQRRVRSQERVDSIDRLLGRVERDLLDRRSTAGPDVWLELARLPLELGVPLPRDLRPGLATDRTHALLLDWQEDVMNHEFPERREYADRTE